MQRIELTTCCIFFVDVAFLKSQGNIFLQAENPQSPALENLRRHWPEEGLGKRWFDGK
jgi:hypothetical protein